MDLNVLSMSGLSDKIATQGMGALAKKETWTQWGDKMNWFQFNKLSDIDKAKQGIGASMNYWDYIKWAGPEALKVEEVL